MGWIKSGRPWEIQGHLANKQQITTLTHWTKYSNIWGWGLGIKRSPEVLNYFNYFLKSELAREPRVIKRMNRVVTTWAPTDTLMYTCEEVYIYIYVRVYICIYTLHTYIYIYTSLSLSVRVCLPGFAVLSLHVFKPCPFRHKHACLSQHRLYAKTVPELARTV